MHLKCFDAEIIDQWSAVALISKDAGDRGSLGQKMRPALQPASIQFQSDHPKSKVWAVPC